MDGVGFFVITEGTATVSVSGSTVAIIRSWGLFGELAMITEQERGATVTAETPLLCLMMAFWIFAGSRKTTRTFPGSSFSTSPAC